MNKLQVAQICNELEKVQGNISDQFDTVWEHLAFSKEPITKLIVDELLDETVKYLTFMQARLNEIKQLVEKPDELVDNSEDQT